METQGKPSSIQYTIVNKKLYDLALAFRNLWLLLLYKQFSNCTRCLRTLKNRFKDFFQSFLCSFRFFSTSIGRHVFPFGKQRAPREAAWPATMITINSNSFYNRNSLILHCATLSTHNMSAILCLVPVPIAPILHPGGDLRIDDLI